MYQQLFYSTFTRNLCSDEQLLKNMLQAALALIEAQERSGIIPHNTLSSVQQALTDFAVEPEQIQPEVALAANAAAPFIKALTSFVRKRDETAAKAIHLGATSQDLVDTATVLKIKDFLSWWKDQAIKLQSRLAQLAREHRSTVMMGRTLMQQARPITFGLKAAVWLQGFQSSNRHLYATETSVLSIQLGGAAGSQNKYITSEVRGFYARILDLQDSPQWHTRRSDLAAFAGALGIAAGTLGKIAKDITLLAQTEVGEVLEPAANGRGTSSTMPHKRNPVLCTAILANTHRIPFLTAAIIAAIPQAHERSAGLWQAEWETLDDLMGLAGGALEKANELLDGLELRPKRMRANIHLTKGLVFAETVSFLLAGKLGKQQAYEWTKTACQKAIDEGKHLREILAAADFGLSESEIDQAFQPGLAIGQSLEIIDEILQKYEDAL